MGKVKFVKNISRANALVQSALNTDKVFFPNDCNWVIMGGREFSGKETSPLYNIKGTVANMAALYALTGMAVNDVYNVLDTGSGTGGYYQYVPYYSVAVGSNTFTTILKEVKIYTDGTHSYYGIINDASSPYVKWCDNSGVVQTDGHGHIYYFYPTINAQTGVTEITYTTELSLACLQGTLQNSSTYGWNAIGVPDLSGYATTTAVTNAINGAIKKVNASAGGIIGGEPSAISLLLNAISSRGNALLHINDSIPLQIYATGSSSGVVEFEYNNTHYYCTYDTSEGTFTVTKSFTLEPESDSDIIDLFDP